MVELKVVVVGGGIGGLSAGMALRRAGYEVEVYERAPEIHPVGAGLCLWPNGAKAMNALGLEDRMRDVSPVLRAVQFRTRDGDLLSDIELDALIASTGQRPYPVARGDLQRVLLEAYGPENVELGAECVAIEDEGGRPTAIFADGRRASGDLLVGADGLRSTVRAHVVGAAQLRSLSWDWEGLVDAAPGLNPPDVFTFYVGDGKRAAMMPVARDRLYYFFDFQLPPEGLEGGMREQLERLYDGWCDPVRRLIETADEASAGNLNLHDLEPIASFVRGRVLLLGDAAHGMTPFLGQGAAMAAEDAIVLARYLQTTSVGIDDALRRYEAERMGRTRAIVAGARAKGEAATGVDAEANQRYYEELRGGSRDFVEAVEQATLAGPLR